MDVRNIRWFKFLEHVLAALQLAHTFGPATGVSAFFDRTQHLLQRAVDLRQLRAVAFIRHSLVAALPGLLLSGVTKR